MGFSPDCSFLRVAYDETKDVTHFAAPDLAVHTTCFVFLMEEIKHGLERPQTAGHATMQHRWLLMRVRCDLHEGRGMAALTRPGTWDW